MTTDTLTVQIALTRQFVSGVEFLIVFLIADLRVLAQLFRHMSLELLRNKIYPTKNNFLGQVATGVLGGLGTPMWELYGVEDMENISLRNDGVKQHDKRDSRRRPSS